MLHRNFQQVSRIITTEKSVLLVIGFNQLKEKLKNMHFNFLAKMFYEDLDAAVMDLFISF